VRRCVGSLLGSTVGENSTAAWILWAKRLAVLLIAIVGHEDGFLGLADGQKDRFLVGLRTG